MTSQTRISSLLLHLYFPVYLLKADVSQEERPTCGQGVHDWLGVETVSCDNPENELGFGTPPSTAKVPICLPKAIVWHKRDLLATNFSFPENKIFLRLL